MKNTGKIYKYFGSFRKVNRAEHGRGTDEFNNCLQYDGENCYTPSGNGYYLRGNNCIFNEDFTKKNCDFKQSYKRRTKVMTR